MRCTSPMVLSPAVDRRGDLDEGLSYVQKALKLDSYNEELHRLAMEIYALTGNKPAVAKQYQALSKSLRDQIDAPPSEESVELYQRLMS